MERKKLNKIKKSIFRHFYLITSVQTTEFRMGMDEIADKLGYDFDTVREVADWYSDTFQPILEIVGDFLIYIPPRKMPKAKKTCPTCGKVAVMSTKQYCKSCYAKKVASVESKEMFKDDRCKYFDSSIKQYLPATANEIAKKKGVSVRSISVKLAYIYKNKERPIGRLKNKKWKYVYFLLGNGNKKVCPHCGKVKPIRKIGVCTSCYHLLFDNEML